MIHYDAFIKVVETGSFTKAADALGYTQSAVSQMVHTIEEELSTVLFTRSRKGVVLTPDGEEFLPYIKNLYNAQMELFEKRKEMQGLQNGIIRIGTFSSVSCNWLPGLMKDFKEQFPSVHFDLQQGEYTMIGNWIKEGSVDFGFVNPDAVTGLTVIPLCVDEMLAVLYPGHVLATRDTVHLAELAKEPYILLDEGDVNEPLEIFNQNHLTPNIQYKVFDDYTIMYMVEKGLGVSILPKLVLSRHHQNILTKEITPRVTRKIALAYKKKNVLPIASRYFIDFIIEKIKGVEMERL